MSAKKKAEKQQVPDSSDRIAGQRIRFVRDMTEEEMKREGWHHVASVIELENGVLLYASQDEEGNDAGALFGYDPKGKKTFLMSGGGS